MTSSRPEQDGFSIREGEFVMLMAMLQALQALAIDVMLPALGIIASDLDVSDPNSRQLVIGVFLISSGAFSLFPGVLADRFGRRRIVLVCLVAYFLISLASALVTDFTALLALRAFLGVFSSGLMIMPMTIIRDRYSGDRMARTQSLVAMVFMVVPMLAPLLGQGVLLVAGWRWIFGVMALLALMVGVWVWFRLPETLHENHRQTIQPKVILANMREAVTHREAIGYFLGTALIQTSILAYVNTSQQLVGEALGAGALFPTIFGGMAFLMASTNFVNSRIVERFGARRVSHAALMGFIAVAALHSWVAWRGGETLWTFVILMSISMCFMSFLGANFQSIAMQPFARIAGSAASILSFIRLVTGAFLAMLVGQAFDGTPRPLTFSLLASGIGALVLVLISERGRLFRRLHYPPDE